MNKQLLTFDRPLVSTDVAIFTVREDALQVLLVQRPADGTTPYAGYWALPGGFIDVQRDADLTASALRKLHEKTGVDSPYLEQLGSWGSAVRDPRGWSTTHVYFALIASAHLALKSGGNATDTRWCPVAPRGGIGEVGTFVSERLAFDHGSLLDAALARLRDKVEYTTLPAYLMAAEFTLTELQRTYEIVLGRRLEKKAFRTRMLSANLLEPSVNLKEGANRPAQLYRVPRGSALHFFARPFGSADR